MIYLPVVQTVSFGLINICINSLNHKKEQKDKCEYDLILKIMW